MTQPNICGAVILYDGTRCAKKRLFSSATHIGVCPHCDAAGTLTWPDDYVPWRKGMVYPGEVKD